MTKKRTSKASSGAAKARKKKSGEKIKQIKKKQIKKQTKKIAAKKTPAKTKAEKKTKKLRPREKKLQDIKKNLLTQRETLLTEAELALNALPGQTVFPDLGDQATAEIDRNFMLRLRSREQKLLKKIDEAIERIDSGTFGICDQCGMDIDIRRLEARPVTNLCIECKTQQEEEERIRES